MSITKSVITCGFDPSGSSRPRLSLRRLSNFRTFYSSCDQRSLLWGNGSWRMKEDNKDRRRSVLIRSIVQPGCPPPSEPPFNFMNWIVGVTITIVLPFLSHKWASLLKLKTEVETAVETVEEIVEAVEKVAGEVEKAAEDIADDLPEGGPLRQAVDFVEHVAERANRDAHSVGDFIDKVQEAEDKLEEYVVLLGDEHANSHTHIDHPLEM